MPLCDLKTVIEACSLIAFKKSVKYGTDPYELGYAQGREDAGNAIDLIDRSQFSEPAVGQVVQTDRAPQPQSTEAVSRTEVNAAAPAAAPKGNWNPNETVEDLHKRLRKINAFIEACRPEPDLPAPPPAATPTPSMSYGELMMLCEGHGTSPIYERFLALERDLAAARAEVDWLKDFLSDPVKKLYNICRAMEEPDGPRAFTTEERELFIGENERQAKEITLLHQRIAQITKKSTGAIKVAESRLAEAEKDAERYRWLRDELNGDTWLMHSLAWIAPASADEESCISPEELDVAVDSALSAARREGEGKGTT